MSTHRIMLRSREREDLVEFTEEVSELVRESRVREGACVLFVRHTTAGLTVNENADPDVPRDLVKALRAMIPDVKFRHGEGNSDAHLLSMMIGSSLSWPYRNARLILGTWQGVYFVELDGPRERKVNVYVV